MIKLLTAVNDEDTMQKSFTLLQFFRCTAVHTPQTEGHGTHNWPSMENSYKYKKSICTTWPSPLHGPVK